MTDKYKGDDYIIYRYSAKDYPFLSYVGKKLARRDKARDKQHREAREISAFHGFIHNAKEAGVSFHDLLEYQETERIYCTDREARIREDFWIGRFDSINDGLNSVLNYPEISSYKDWEHEWHNKGLSTPPMIRLRVTEKRHICIWLSKLRIERDERYDILRRITQNMLQVIKEGGRGIRYLNQDEEICDLIELYRDKFTECRLLTKQEAEINRAKQNKIEIESLRKRIEKHNPDELAYDGAEEYEQEGLRVGAEVGNTEFEISPIDVFRDFGMRTIIQQVWHQVRIRTRRKYKELLQFYARNIAWTMLVTIVVPVLIILILVNL